MCPETLSTKQASPIAVVSIYLCFQSQSCCLGDTILLVSNGTLLLARAWAWRLCSTFFSLRAWWFTLCVHNPGGAKYSYNEMSWGIPLLFYWERRKQKKLNSPWASMGKHTQWVTCIGKPLRDLADRSDQQWFKTSICRKQEDDAPLLGTQQEARLERALLCVSNNQGVTGRFCY